MSKTSTREEREAAIAYVRERASLIDSLGGSADGSFVDAEHLRALVTVFDVFEAHKVDLLFARRETAKMKQEMDDALGYLAQGRRDRDLDVAAAMEHVVALLSIIQRVRLRADPLSDENTDPLDVVWEALTEEQRARVRAATPEAVACKGACCARPEGAVNHVPGHIFVGWGLGWQPCRCGCHRLPTFLGGDER